LEQVDPIDEPMKARTFGIEREDWGIGDRGDKGADGARRVEVDRRMRT
jgi:hypothetical protein